MGWGISLGGELQLPCTACGQSRTDLVVSQKKQHKTSVSYYLKSIKCTFLNCSQCIYVSCLLSLKKYPWPAIQACGINRLDVSNSCPSYTTAVTRFAGSATWKPWGRWQEGQQGSWSTLRFLPLLEQVQNAIFKDFCLTEIDRKLKRLTSLTVLKFWDQKLCLTFFFFGHWVGGGLNQTMTSLHFIFIFYATFARIWDLRNVVQKVNPFTLFLFLLRTLLLRILLPLSLVSLLFTHPKVEFSRIQLHNH